MILSHSSRIFDSDNDGIDNDDDNDENFSLVYFSLAIFLSQHLHLSSCSISNTKPVQFSRSVVSDSLQPHEPQHTRPPCPLPTPRVHRNPCPLSQWCHPTISELELNTHKSTSWWRIIRMVYLFVNHSKENSISNKYAKTNKANNKLRWAVTSSRYFREVSRMPQLQQIEHIESGAALSHLRHKES